MDITSYLALGIDPGRIFQALGQKIDSWQRDVLYSTDARVLLNCSRQAGKSTVVAALALHEALFQPGGALILIVAPSLRQSEELFRKIQQGYHALSTPVLTRRLSLREMELRNGSRIVCLPAREATIRAYGGVRLLLIDEAARVPDVVYRTVRPMLAVSQGRLVALSTPNGCQGWFYRAWLEGDWRRFKIPWHECPRISPEFIAEERLALGDDWVRQEYEGDFMARIGRVYPDWELAFVEEPPPHDGRGVGGVDFGWKSPFAAVWGIVDRDDVLWILGELYQTERTVEEMAPTLAALGPTVWHADPSSPAEIIRLRSVNMTVLPGKNHLFLGIGAVTARLRTGRLKIVTSACPNLVREGQNYRYPSGERGDPNRPLDRDDHGLDALRYLVAGLPAMFQTPVVDPAVVEKPAPLNVASEELWETVHSAE